MVFYFIENVVATSLFFLFVLTSRFSWFCIQVISLFLILYSIVLILGMSWTFGLYPGHYEYYILQILNSVIILQWLLFSFLLLLLVLFFFFLISVFLSCAWALNCVSWEAILVLVQTLVTCHWVHSTHV